MSILVQLAVVGAGARGSNYARIAANEGLAKVVAVAEPDLHRRELFLAEHDIDPANVFTSWEELVAQPRLADAVIIATHDREHVEPAVAFADKGYHLLLEKPMAPTEDESRRIVESAEINSVMLAVCHVMRYSLYTRALKRILDSGEIGDIVTIEHLEPIGWWHFAHSYVRGNWASESKSSSMLMSKSSHDLDWLSYIIGERATRVSSFGGLYHFKPENKPVGAGERCVDCPLRNTCSFSATLIYPRFLGDPVSERWPLQVLTPKVSAESVNEAIRIGPYGECVYNGQNDVVDHQVVNLEYESGATATFTVTAFTTLDFRKTRIFGTKGSIDGDGVSLKIHDFTTDTERIEDAGGAGGASAADGHGGADTELVRTFVAAVAAANPSLLTSGPRESLASHQLVWAAEVSRKTGSTVTLVDQEVLALG